MMAKRNQDKKENELFYFKPLDSLFIKNISANN